jgi:hypothetical protein
MKRPRLKTSSVRLTREALRLVALARGLSRSGSRFEDAYWERELAIDLDRLLDSGAHAAIDSALEHLHAQLPLAYDTLIDEVERCAESLDKDGVQTVLVAAPILAWSRYAIASGPLKPEQVERLEGHFRRIIAASGVDVVLSPVLYSIDQLPRRPADARTLLKKLSASKSKADAATRASFKRLPQTAPLLADTRFIVASFTVPRGGALFRWQVISEADDALREQALEDWRVVLTRELPDMLPGCVLEASLPDGFYVAWRDSDLAIRPYGIHAAVAFVAAALDTPPGKIRAIIAPFGDQEIEEYRIGFALEGDNEIVHGVVWPLYGREEGSESGGSLEQIVGLLHEHELAEVLALDTQFPLEFCDDCGAPLFSDPNGELLHAELPSEIDPAPAHLH